MKVANGEDVNIKFEKPEEDSIVLRVDLVLTLLDDSGVLAWCSDKIGIE